MDKEYEKKSAYHHIDRLKKMQEQGINYIGGFPIELFILALETYKDMDSNTEPYLCNSLINHLINIILVGKVEKMEVPTLFDLLLNIATHFYNLGVGDERKDLIELREKAMQKYDFATMKTDYPLTEDDCFEKQ